MERAVSEGRQETALQGLVQAKGSAKPIPFLYVLMALSSFPISVALASASSMATLMVEASTIPSK